MIDSAAIKEAWIKCYLDETIEDPHSAFAELLGIPRQEAKQLCYKFMYQFTLTRVLARRIRDED